MPHFEPVVLFFLLGALAGLVRSDLRIPGVLYESLSIFLLLAIGLKGGVELARYPLASLALPAFVVVAAAALIPLVAYPILRRLGHALACRRRIHCRSLRIGEASSRLRWRRLTSCDWVRSPTAHREAETAKAHRG